LGRRGNRHEVKNRERGKIVHVVFKYRSRSCCMWKGVGPRGVTHPPSCEVDILFKDDVTVLLLLCVSFVVIDERHGREDWRESIKGFKEEGVEAGM
jgi:hypothetical protein